MSDALSEGTGLDDDDTRPSYYGGPDNPYEPVKVWRDLGMGPAAHFATALKYLHRAGKKGDEEMKDLKKAEWYLNTAAELGYTWSQRGRMDPDEIIAAWGTPEGLDDVVYLALHGGAREAAIGLRAYIVWRGEQME